MSKLKTPVNSNDHFQGNESATLILVEYGDYQCPHCGRAYPIIKRVQKKLGDKLKFVFRNFPLAESHPDATNAAVSSEVAGAHGKFWEMHDMLFENQEALDGDSLISYAAKIGIKAAQFESEFEKPEFLKKVEADFESGVRSGVNGTPSFFVNGEKYNGDWDEEPLLAFLAEHV